VEGDKLLRIVIARLQYRQAGSAKNWATSFLGTMQSTLILTRSDEKNSTNETHKGTTGGKGAVKNKRAFRNMFLDLWPYFITSLVAD
jgi:hypothetical protein